MTDDSHIHLFERGFKANLLPDAEIEEYEKLRNLGGIDFALVIGYEGNEHFKGNNSYILKLAVANPWIHPVSYIDPSSKSADFQITNALEIGFLGCSFYLIEQGEKLSENVISSLNKIGESGAIVSVNANPSAITRYQDQFAQLSTCKILISHMGLPGPESAHSQVQIRERMGALLTLRKLPNVFVKLSGLYAVDPIHPYAGARPYVRELLDSFGASRLMWGSDYSPSMDYGTAAQVASVPDWIAQELTAGEYERITKSNLRSLLPASVR